MLDTLLVAELKTNGLPSSHGKMWDEQKSSLGRLWDRIIVQMYV